MSATEPDKERRMTLGEHLEELRWRLLYALIGLAVAMAISLLFSTELIKLLEAPYQKATGGDKLNIANVQGGFNIWMKITLISGLVLASPWVFHQLWMFVAAGLYPNEKKYVRLAVPFSALLFVMGVAFFLLFVAVPALKFFTWVNTGWLDTHPVIMLPDYIDFMTGMMFIFGVIFQMPLVVLVLARIGLVGMKGLNKYRRHVIVGIFVFSAIFAPGDAWSMVLMSLPMWLLYEFGIFLAWLLVLRHAKEEDELPPPPAPLGSQPTDAPANDLQAVLDGKREGIVGGDQSREQLVEDYQPLPAPAEQTPLTPEELAHEEAIRKANEEDAAQTPPPPPSLN